MRKGKRSVSVLYQYVMSHCGITLFFCALIGVGLYSYFIGQYTQSVIKNETQKAEVLLNDLEAQYSNMAETAFSVTRDITNGYNELQHNNYLELELINSMSRHAGGSLFTRNFFLLFQNQPKLYSTLSSSTSGTSYQYPLFMDYYLKCGDPDGLFGTLSRTVSQTVLTVPGSDRILFVFPLRVYSSSVNAVLCFFVTQTEMQNRAQLVTGDMKNCTVYYGDTALYEIAMEEYPVSGDTRVYHMTSEERHFSMDLRVDPAWFISALLSYLTLLLFGLLAVLLVIVITFIVSARHYKPIESINSMVGAAGSRNELTNIETRVRDIMEEMIRNEEQIDRQMNLLREQTLHLLLSGEYIPGSCDQLLDKTGIQAAERKNGILLLQFTEPDQAEFDEVVAALEDLSTPNARLYPFHDKNESRMVVLLNVSMNSDLLSTGVLDLIQNLLETRRLPYSFGCGCLYDDLVHLPASYAEAQDDLLGRSMTASIPSSEESSAYFNKIIAFTRLGDAKHALPLLREYASVSERLCPSLMWQRCMYVDFMHMLVNLAHEHGIEIAPNRISVVLTAPAIPVLLEGVSDLTRYICEQIGSESDRDAADRHSVTDRVLAYIGEHFRENDLSLDKIASEFHLSPVYLSAQLKSVAGIGYKDHVLHLRMEHARECLARGMSTNDTCAECGYVNVSHFIKTFKQTVGVTPSVYQKSTYLTKGSGTGDP